MRTIIVKNVDEYYIQEKEIIKKRENAVLHFTCDTRNTTDRYFFYQDGYSVTCEAKCEDTLFAQYHYGESLPYKMTNIFGTVLYSR